jgi:hypothetical protein
LEFSKLHAQFKKINFMNTENELTKKINTRRKLIAGLGVLALFPILKYGFFSKKKEIISCAPETNKQTMKMLTQDGRLVEVEISKMNSTKEKITNTQLQNWVKRA